MTTKMSLRDSDLRQAAHEDGIRPGDKNFKTAGIVATTDSGRGGSHGRAETLDL